MTHLLATRRSRHHLIRAVTGFAAGGLLSLLGVDTAGAARCRRVGTVCHTSDQCCPGAVCQPVRASRRSRHGRCTCPQGSTVCFDGCAGPNDLCPPCLGDGTPCTRSADCCGDLVCHGEAGGSVCRCPHDLTLCGDRCVDTTRDPDNCGSCGSICPAPNDCFTPCDDGLTYCGDIGGVACA